MIRLQKYLAECGVASRRASEQLIAAGRVHVNSVPAMLGQSIDPDRDEVAVDGAPLARDEKVYVVLNKPAGVITTAKDTHGRATVLECVEAVKARVYPVGRLDMDVEGVLLFTNDGELAHRLMHPRYGIDKEYHAVVYGCVTPEILRRMEAGVRLDDGIAVAARAAILQAAPGHSRIRLTLREGRKHEVKRLCAAVGHPVRSLRRTAFCGITADGMRPGEWRYLDPEEIRRLRAAANLIDTRKREH